MQQCVVDNLTTSGYVSHPLAWEKMQRPDSSLAYPGGTPEVLQEIAALMTPSVVGTAYGPIFFVSDTLHEQIYGTLILNHLITLPICV